MPSNSEEGSCVGIETSTLATEFFITAKHECALLGVYKMYSIVIEMRTAVGINLKGCGLEQIYGVSLFPQYKLQNQYGRVSNMKREGV